ncbi:MAG: vWA domain-containing protein [Candidatus Brocadiia bacterium]
MKFVLSFLGALCVLLVSGVCYAETGNAYILIDKSYSMGRGVSSDPQRRSRYQLVEEKALETAQLHLSRKDTVTAIFYDTSVSRPMEIFSIDELKQLFSGKRPSGDTNIWDAMAAVLDLMKNSDARLMYVSIFSDGEQTVGSRLSKDQVFAAYNDYFVHVQQHTIFNLFQWDWGGNATDIAQGMKTASDDAENKNPNYQGNIRTDNPSDLPISVDCQLAVAGGLIGFTSSSVFSGVTVPFVTTVQPVNLFKRDLEIRIESAYLMKDGLRSPAMLVFDAPILVKAGSASSVVQTSARLTGWKEGMALGTEFTAGLRLRSEDRQAMLYSSIVRVMVSDDPRFWVVHPDKGDKTQFSLPVGETAEIPIEVGRNAEAARLGVKATVEVSLMDHTGVSATFLTATGQTIGADKDSLTLDLTSPNKLILRVQPEPKVASFVLMRLIFRAFEKEISFPISLEVEKGIITAERIFSGRFPTAGMKIGEWTEITPTAFSLTRGQDFLAGMSVQYELAGIPEGIEARLVCGKDRLPRGSVTLTDRTVFLGLEVRLVDPAAVASADKKGWNWCVRFALPNENDKRRCVITPESLTLPGLIPAEPSYTAELTSEGWGIPLIPSREQTVSVIVTWNSSADGESLNIDFPPEDPEVIVRLKSAPLVRLQSTGTAEEEQRQMVVQFGVMLKQPLAEPIRRTVTFRGQGKLARISRTIVLTMVTAECRLQIKFTLTIHTVPITLECWVKVGKVEISSESDTHSIATVDFDVKRIPSVEFKFRDRFLRENSTGRIQVPRTKRAAAYDLYVKLSRDFCKLATDSREIQVPIGVLPQPMLTINGYDAWGDEIRLQYVVPHVTLTSEGEKWTQPIKIGVLPSKAGAKITTKNIESCGWKIADGGLDRTTLLFESEVLLGNGNPDLVTEVLFDATGKSSATLREMLEDWNLVLTLKTDLAQSWLTSTIYSFEIPIKSLVSTEPKLLTIEGRVPAVLPVPVVILLALLAVLGFYVFMKTPRNHLPGISSDIHDDTSQREPKPPLRLKDVDGE